MKRNPLAKKETEEKLEKMVSDFMDQCEKEGLTFLEVQAIAKLLDQTVSAAFTKRIAEISETIMFTTE